jgi:hypothetical protein
VVVVVGRPGRVVVGCGIRAEPGDGMVIVPATSSRLTGATAAASHRPARGRWFPQTRSFVSWPIPDLPLVDPVEARSRTAITDR